LFLLLLTQVNVDELRKLQRVDASAISQKKQLSEMDVLAVVQNDSTYLQQAEGVKYYRKPFEFLSLGIMAYVGNDRALTQVCLK
jgi:hypothetical protein